MNKKRLFNTLFLFFIFVPMVVLFYRLIHESGHAIVTLLHGGEIIEFKLFPNAYTSTSYVDYSVFGEMLFNAGGDLLLLFVSVIIICFYRDNIKSLLYNLCYRLGTLAVVSLIFRWVTIPIISLFTMPPPMDDVTKFIRISNLPPLLISTCATILIGAFVFLSCVKGMWKISKKYIIIALSVVVITGILTPLMSKTVFDISFRAENAFEEENREIHFTIDQTNVYTIDVTSHSQGFVTALCITDKNNGVVFQTINETFAFSSTRELDEGDYTLSLIYLADYDALEQLLDTWQETVSSEGKNNLREAFSHDNNGDYSFTCYIQIRR